jgi:Tfp pilus assembly protein PilO
MRSLVRVVISAVEANRRLLPAFVVIVILAALLIGRSGYRYHLSALEEIASTAERYEAFQSVLDRAGDFEKLRKKDDERVREFERGLLGADKPSTGAAKLHEAFKELASKRGVAISSVRPLSAVYTESYAKVGVEFLVKGRLVELKDLLYDMQASPVLMGVRSIRIKSDAEGSPSLDATIVVEGAIRKQSGD